MTPKGKKTLIISACVLAIAGAVGYYLYKRKKDKEADATLSANTATNASVTNSATDTSKNQATASQVKTNTSSVKAPTMLSQDVKKFQNWFNTTNYAKKGKLSITGVADTSTLAAWNAKTPGALPTVGATYSYLVNAKKI